MTAHAARPASHAQGDAAHTVRLRCAHAGEAPALWSAIFTERSWKQTDAPYLPLVVPSQEAFARGLFARLAAGRDAQLIEHRGQPVGIVTAYWECESTRWLEAGIAIWRAEHRGAGLGRQALRLWTGHLFDTFEVERVGLATWSGNAALVRCALSLGFSVEGCLRRVRYHEGRYHDAIRLGVLREEWHPSG